MSASDFADVWVKDEKKYLRSIRKCPREVEMTLDEHAVGFGPVCQFNTDCKLYGLYEACLYVAGYIKDGYYTTGVMDKLVNECRKLIRKEVARQIASDRKAAAKRYNLNDLI